MKSDRPETPHWVFILSGSAVIIISVLAQLITGPVWDIISKIALSVGVSIIAVSVVDWIWRKVGGNPLMNAILELRNSTTLLSDLYGTGVKRVFISRNLTSDYKRILIEKMNNAKEVDMLGMALRSGWASTTEFQEALKTRAKSGKTTFRIAVFDPESKVAAQRSFEEDGKPTQRIAESAASTLRILAAIKAGLSKQDKKNLIIRVVTETGLYCSIIRADDLILMTRYFLHLSGGNSETMVIEGKDSSFYKLYLDEFNAVWGRSVDWPR